MRVLIPYIRLSDKHDQGYSTASLVPATRVSTSGVFPHSYHRHRHRHIIDNPVQKSSLIN